MFWHESKVAGQSAFENMEMVSYKLLEVDLHRIAGPFPQKPPGLVVSPLAAVPKKESDQIRIIHDLSFPQDNSLNSHIPRELSSVEYELIDDCIDIILKVGSGCLITKSDISSAFCTLPIAVDNCCRQLPFVRFSVAG